MSKRCKRRLARQMFLLEGNCRLLFSVHRSVNCLRQMLVSSRVKSNKFNDPIRHVSNIDLEFILVATGIQGGASQVIFSQQQVSFSTVLSIDYWITAFLKGCHINFGSLISATIAPEARTVPTAACVAAATAAAAATSTETYRHSSAINYQTETF